MSIFQFTHEEGNGEKKYSDLLSDPSDLLMLAKAVGAGHYISVDKWKTKGDILLNEEARAIPYVRFF